MIVRIKYFLIRQAYVRARCYYEINKKAISEGMRC